MLTTVIFLLFSMYEA